VNPVSRTVPPEPSDGDAWDRLKTLYLALIDALDEERRALAEADAGALESCVAHKNALCRALAAYGDRRRLHGASAVLVADSGCCGRGGSAG